MLWRFQDRCATLLRLGLENVVRAGVYRSLVKLGAYRYLLPVAPAHAPPFLSWATGEHKQPDLPLSSREYFYAIAQRIAAGELQIFSNRWIRAGFPPDWRQSVLSESGALAPLVHWSDIPDFGLAGGDIKGYWEPARFDALLALALGWVCSGNADLKRASDGWLQSWVLENPDNLGVQ